MYNEDKSKVINAPTITNVTEGVQETTEIIIVPYFDGPTIACVSNSIIMNDYCKAYLIETDGEINYYVLVNPESMKMERRANRVIVDQELNEVIIFDDFFIVPFSKEGEIVSFTNDKLWYFLEKFQETYVFLYDIYEQRHTSKPFLHSKYLARTIRYEVRNGATKVSELRDSLKKQIYNRLLYTIGSHDKTLRYCDIEELYKNRALRDVVILIKTV